MSNLAIWSQIFKNTKGKKGKEKDQTKEGKESLLCTKHKNRGAWHTLWDPVETSTLMWMKHMELVQK